MNEAQKARLMARVEEWQLRVVTENYYAKLLNDEFEEIADGTLEAILIPGINPTHKTIANDALVADVIFHPNVRADFSMLDDFKYRCGGIHITKLINAQYIPLPIHLWQWSVLKKICSHVHDKLFDQVGLTVQLGLTFQFHDTASGTQFLYREFYPHELDSHGKFPPEVETSKAVNLVTMAPATKCEVLI